jgi:predicted peptidase
LDGGFEEMIMSRKLFYLRVFFVVFALTAGALAASAQRTETGFLNRSIMFNGSEYRYVVYVPREFNRKQSYPVILALHGGGEYGSDGLKQTTGGLARAIRLNPERFPVIVVFPQAKADNTPGWQQEGGKAALEALDRSIKEFRGDARRVYLTGLSAGGNGSWFLLLHYPERFAAAIVVCGFISKHKGSTSGVDYPALAPADATDAYAYVVKRVAKIPIWIFHGDADQNISVEESKKMFAALKAISTDVQYTELPGVDHNAWDPAYSRADVIEWLLKQKKR